jgi:hypothetical protein
LHGCRIADHPHAMKNSLLPALLIIVTVATSLWLIRSNAERGSNGPSVQPGIFQSTKRDKGLIASAALDSPHNAMTGTAPTSIEATATADWRVILLAGDDDHAWTRAVLLALAEELTHRGAIAVLAPKSRQPYEPLPLGCDGSLRITSQSDATALTHPSAINASLAIEVIPTRVPAGHPAARWCPDLPAAAPSTLRIVHRSAPVGSPAWPGWFAAVARHIAADVLRHLQVPDAITDTADHVQLTSWAVAANQVQLDRLPSPPQGDVMERIVAFQHPLVRGWIGQLSPIPITQRDGSTRSARDELTRRLTRGGWKRQPAASASTSDAEPDLWLMPKPLSDGSELLRLISIAADGTIVEWQERPRPTTLWQAWRDAAAQGDALAKRQIERHRSTAGIPADLR